MSGSVLRILALAAGAAVVLAMLLALGPPFPVVIFTTIGLAVWLAVFVWALTERRKGSPDWWRHLWVLGLATAFWWVGESLALRLGKYHYPDLPLRVPFPGGGTPAEPGPIVPLLAWLAKLGGGELGMGPRCPAWSWDVPLPVIAFEGAILFGLYRISRIRLKADRGDGLRPALAAAGLCGLLFVNLTTIFDPVVSVTKWCDPIVPDPAYQGLKFGLWEWFTNDQHTGYWFGVPIVNYAAWFLSAATFTFVARLDEYRPRAARLWSALYIGGAVVFLAVLFALLIPLKVALDVVLVHGQRHLFTPHAVFAKPVWQFIVFGSLLVWGVRQVVRGWHTRSNTKFDLISSLPQLAVWVLCLACLLVQWHTRIVVIWTVTAVVVATAIFWPAVQRIVAWVMALLFGRRTPPAEVVDVR